MIVNKLSSAQACKTATNNVDMISKSTSESAHTEIAVTSEPGQFGVLMVLYYYLILQIAYYRNRQNEHIINKF